MLGNIAGEKIRKDSFSSKQHSTLITPFFSFSKGEIKDFFFRVDRISSPAPYAEKKRNKIERQRERERERWQNRGEKTRNFSLSLLFLQMELNKVSFPPSINPHVDGGNGWVGGDS